GAAFTKTNCDAVSLGPVKADQLSTGGAHGSQGQTASAAKKRAAPVTKNNCDKKGGREISMFRVRPEHLQGLAAQQLESFEARMTAHLREMFPEEVAPFEDVALGLIVHKGCEVAERWRIEEEAHVERFLELLVSFPQLRRK